MEKILDGIVELLKLLDPKTQDKVSAKRRWLLHKDYIQPLDDGGEENDPPDDPGGSRAKDIYKAAKYGLHEGLLSGIFFGGCWGLCKQMDAYLHSTETCKEGSPRDNDSVHHSRRGGSQDRSRGSFSDPGSSKPSNQNSKKSFKSDGEEKEKSDRSLGTYSGAGSNSKNSVRESRSPFYSSSVQSSQANNAKSNEFVNRSSGIRSVGPSSTTTYESIRNRYRSGEKIEIVGFALIETTGSNDSKDSDSRKDSTSSKDTVSDEEETSKKSQHIVEESTAESTVADSAHESSHGRSKASSKSGHTSSLERGKSTASNVLDYFKYGSQHASATQQSNVLDILDRDPSRQTSEKSTKKSSRHSSAAHEISSSKSKESSNKIHRKSSSKVFKSSSNQKSSAKENESLNTEGITGSFTKNDYSSERGRGSDDRWTSQKGSVRGQEPSDLNVMDVNKISKSILIDADLISNGYSEPEVDNGPDSYTNGALPEWSVSNISEIGSQPLGQSASDGSNLQLRSTRSRIPESQHSSAEDYSVIDKTTDSSQSKPALGNVKSKATYEEEPSRAQSKYTYGNESVADMGRSKSNIKSSKSGAAAEPREEPSHVQSKHAYENESSADVGRSKSSVKSSKSRASEEPSRVQSKYAYENESSADVGRSKSSVKSSKSGAAAHNEEQNRGQSTYAFSDRSREAPESKTTVGRSKSRMPPFEEEESSELQSKYTYGNDSSAEVGRSKSNIKSSKSGAAAHNEEQNRGQSTYAFSDRSREAPESKTTVGRSKSRMPPFEEEEPSEIQSKYTYGNDSSAEVGRSKSRVTVVTDDTGPRDEGRSTSRYGMSESASRENQESGMYISTSSFIQKVGPASTDNSRSFIEKSSGKGSGYSETKCDGFQLLSVFNDSVIVLTACNCALVLGVVCSVISTTKASLGI